MANSAIPSFVVRIVPLRGANPLKPFPPLTASTVATGVTGASLHPLRRFKPPDGFPVKTATAEQEKDHEENQ